LQKLEQGARLAGQGKLVDDFVTSLNRAGEAAVPEVGGIFNDAIQAMTIEDAMQLWKGPNDAATQYFRKVGEPRLVEKIRPIVTTATNKVGVTQSYKQFASKAAFLSPFLKKDQQSALDLDSYVTDKAMNGLFHMIAKEEANIRQNPTARTTSLLQRMFGLGK
jgi:nucleotidyltransferase/DNA polymerase involved in DNA repair